MDNLKVLVVSHKNDNYIRRDAPYFPIHVGKTLHPNVNLNCQTDDEGDNISSKNASYCELTGIYWGWKNIKDVKYLGVCHYRRYFKMNLTDAVVSKYLSTYDIIATNIGKMYDRTSRAKNLMIFTSKEDVTLLIDTILSLHPEYYDQVLKYFYNSRFSYSYNMFIASKKIYDEYCEFMFPILFETEKRLKNHGYSRQNRAIAYFGEWMLGLFILCKGLKVKSVPVEYCGFKEKRFPNLYRFLKMCSVEVIACVLYFFKPAPRKIIVEDDVRVGFKNDGIELRVL